MSRRRSLPAGRALLLVLAVLAVNFLPGSAAAAGTGWVHVGAEHVSGTDERALAVVAVKTDVWAVGYSVNSVGGATEFRALAERFDGTKFVRVGIPDRETAPARDFLNGAAGTAPDDVWAVGTSLGDGTPDQALIEHWDGARWAITPGPSPAPGSVDLQAVTAASGSNAWAVGAVVPPGAFYQQPLALHWDGNRWQPAAIPAVPGCTGHSYLTAVTASPKGSVWATGWCGSGGTGPAQGYVLHVVDGSWTIATVIGQPTAPDSQTYGIAASNDRDVWVVGFYRKAGPGTSAALTYHYDGTRWRLAAGPSAASGLAAITIGRSGIWSVGDGASSQPPFAGPSIARYKGGTWHNQVTSVDFGSLSAVTTARHGVLWAVGTYFLPDGHAGLLILRR